MWLISINILSPMNFLIRKGITPRHLTWSLLIFVSTLWAQTSQYRDVVYTKNGSIIKGIILEQIPNKSLTIQTIDHSLFVVEMTEVVKIGKEPIPTSYSETNPSDETGYRGILSSGYMVGIGETELNRISVDYINAYKTSTLYSIGVGVGLRLYLDQQIKQTNYRLKSNGLIPIYIDFRRRFTSKRVSPLFLSQIGYSIYTDGKSAGRYGKIGVGLDIRLIGH